MDTHKTLQELPEISERERKRYARHIIIPEVGESGQKKLKSSSSLIVGTGGLGSPVAYYLCAAGVGKIGLVDYDKVDITNLQRQILHFDGDVGRPKLKSAKEKLSDLNPDVKIELHEIKLTSENAMEVISEYDIVIDGTDNFASRYLINDACVFLKKPNVHGSIFRFEGQVTVFDAVQGACYRCLFPEPPPAEAAPNCAEAGVLGVLPGIVGCIQATEAVKYLLNIGDSLCGKLLTIDALTMEFRTYEIKKDPGCKVCSENPQITELIDYEEFCGVNQENEKQYGVQQIDVKQLAQKIQNEEGFILLDVREEFELAISKLDNFVHISMDDIYERHTELDKEKEILVICRTGNRSNKVAAYLMNKGFKNVKNVAGGINAFAEEIDPSIAVY